MKLICSYYKRIVFYSFLFIFIAAASANAQQVSKTINIDKDWKFHLGDVTGGEQTSFNDNDWRKLDVPHDWSIEGSYDSLAITKRGGGYLPAGIGWYRKTFTLPKSNAGKRIYIELEGVMANSDVWINGHLLGHRPFGYLPLLYDLTGHLNFDKPNLIAVRADNSVQPASRWYTGAGIYRHVYLTIVNPIHLERWGVFIHTPEVTPQTAQVAIQASIINQSAKSSQVMIQTTITSPTGKQFKTKSTFYTIAAGQALQTDQSITVPDPEI